MTTPEVPMPVAMPEVPAPVSTRTGRGVVAWLAFVLVCLSSALAGLLESLLVPLYVGSTLVPIAVVAALATTIGLPLLARTVLPTTLGVATPFAVWFVVLVGFGVYTRPEGDVILPGGDPQWVAYGVLFGGTLAGMITVVSAIPRSTATRRTGPPR